MHPNHHRAIKDIWRASVHVIYLLMGCFSVLSCGEESLGEITDDVPPLAPEVTILHDVNALGDRGYNDAINRGLRQGKNEYGYRLQMYVPENYEEAETTFVRWIEARNEGRRRLLVLGSDSYEFLVEKYADRIPRTDSTEVLWLESRREDLPVSTLFMPLYGASYATAYLTSFIPHADSCAIVCAMPSEGTMADVVKGFNDCMKRQRGSKAEVFYLAEDPSGFNMADSLYHLCFTLEQTYGFVLPVAGGSNEGLYEFTREYPHTFYTAGMDGDYSYQSPTLFVSIVKHIDRALLRTLDLWMNGEPLPHHQRLGLESGFVELVPSIYGVIEGIESPIAEIRKEATDKENEYEKEK